MKHAVYLPPFGSFGDADLLVTMATEAEAAGWDGFFLWDHILSGDDVPLVDTWISLTAIACATSRIRIAPLVTPLPRRRVWKVAREATTLDHLSHGRLTLGVGLGIDFWREFSAFSEPATDDRARATLVDDGIEILRGLWSGEPVTYGGDASSVTDVRFLPVPRQTPAIPIWSAALWPLRAGGGPWRRAARVDGVMPFGPRGPIRPDDIEGLRDRLGVGADFDVCLHGPVEWAADYAAAGVSWFCLSLLPDEPVDEALDLMRAGPPRPGP